MIYILINYIGVNYIEILDKKLGSNLTFLDSIVFFVLLFLLHLIFRRSTLHSIVFPTIVFIGIIGFFIWSIILMFFSFGSDMASERLVLYRNMSDTTLTIDERLFRAGVLGSDYYDTVVSKKIFPHIRWTTKFDRNDLNTEKWIKE